MNFARVMDTYSPLLLDAIEAVDTDLRNEISHPGEIQGEHLIEETSTVQKLNEETALLRTTAPALLEQMLAGADKHHQEPETVPQPEMQMKFITEDLLVPVTNQELLSTHRCSTNLPGTSTVDVNTNNYDLQCDNPYQGTEAVENNTNIQMHTDDPLKDYDFDGIDFDQGADDLLDDDNFVKFASTLEQDTMLPQPESSNAVCVLCGESYVLCRTKDIAIPNICEDCQMKSGYEGIPRSDTHKCYKCQAVLADPKLLEEHIVTCYNMTNNAKAYELKCQMCDNIYVVRKALSQHCKMVHNMDVSGTKLRPYKCPDCQQQFAYPTLLEHHASKHYKPKRYVCNVCKNRFSLKRYLIIHFHKHTENFACPECFKKFISGKSLHQHFVMFHSDVKPFQCDICARGYATQNLLTTHLKQHDAFKKKMFTCQHCQKCFGSQFKLKEHAAMHNEMKWNCDLCNKGFSSRQALQRHTVSHTELRPWACDICPKTFRQEHSLRTHHLIHAGIKPYICECGSAYRTKAQLKTHRPKCVLKR